MKKILGIVAVGFALFMSPSAKAACPNPFKMLDADQVRQNISTSVDGSGNCEFNFSAANLQNPSVLSAAQSYAGGSSQPVGLLSDGSLIVNGQIRTPPVSCTSACTTFGIGSNGVLFTLQTWPFGTVDVDVISPGTNGIISYEVSNNVELGAGCPGGTWLPILGNRAGASTIAAASSAVSDHFLFSTTASCFRARVSSYSSGTVTAGATQTGYSTMPRSMVMVGSGAASVPAFPAANGTAVPVAAYPYPAGATAANATSGVVAAGTASAAITGVASKFTYITGIQFTSSGASAAASVDCTVSDGTTTLFHFTASALAGVNLGNPDKIYNFVGSPLVSGATGRTMTASCPSLGAGNTNEVMNIQGYAL